MRATVGEHTLVVPLFNDFCCRLVPNPGSHEASVELVSIHLDGITIPEPRQDGDHFRGDGVSLRQHLAEGEGLHQGCGRTKPVHRATGETAIGIGSDGAQCDTLRMASS